MNVQNDITKFIDEVSKVLPLENKLVRMDSAPMFGFELKLTGAKEYKGAPIDDSGVYQIEVPVYEGVMVQQINEDGETINQPVIRYTDHRHLLRLAYFRKGLPAIYSYLSKYMTEESVQKVRNHFMRKS